MGCVMKNALKKLSGKFNLAAAGTVLFTAAATMIGQLQSAMAMPISTQIAINNMNTMNAVNAMNAANIAANSGSGSIGTAGGPILSLDPFLAALVVGGAAAATGIGLAAHHFRNSNSYRRKLSLSKVFNAENAMIGTLGGAVGCLFGMLALVLSIGLTGASDANTGFALATVGTGAVVGAPILVKLFN